MKFLGWLPVEIISLIRHVTSGPPDAGLQRQKTRRAAPSRIIIDLEEVLRRVLH